MPHLTVSVLPCGAASLSLHTGMLSADHHQYIGGVAGSVRQSSRQQDDFDMLSGILISVAGTVVGGLIVAAIVAVVSSRRSSRVHAFFTVVSIPVPQIGHRGRQAMEELMHSQEWDQWSDTARSVWYQSAIKAVSIEVRNGRRIRSGEVEIILKNAMLWYFRDYLPGNIGDKLKIGTIDPHDKVVILALTIDIGMRSEVRVLEDGQRARVEPQNLDYYEDVFGIARFVRTFPNLIGGVAILVLYLAFQWLIWTFGTHFL